MKRRWICAVAVSFGLGVAAGCGFGDAAAPPAGPGAAAEAAAESTVRTDREPIEKRFPGLGAFSSVHWLGGTVGDDRVPGPSLYFVEAVVQLAATDLTRLTANPDLATAADPKPPAPLLPFVPEAGGWSRSEQLEAGFAPPGWQAEILLHRDTGTAVISARGE